MTFEEAQKLASICPEWMVGSLNEMFPEHIWRVENGTVRALSRTASAEQKAAVDQVARFGYLGTR